MNNKLENVEIIGNRVLIKQNKTIEKIGILFLSNNAKIEKSSGKILKIGKGIDGKYPDFLKEDDEIFYDLNSGVKFEFDEEEFLVIENSSILIIFRDNEPNVIGPRILIEKLEPKKEKGILILSEDAREEQFNGIVASIGENKGYNVKIGDKVVYDKYSGISFDFNDKKYIIVELNYLIMKIK